VARAAAVALVLVATLPAPALAVSLTRGPYLQLLTTTAVTVVWNTAAPAVRRSWRARAARCA
jgi:hypothetical protein